MNKDSREELRMDAYYYSFERTGNDAIDKILSAVACAGKAYHNTESWLDEDGMATYCGHKGKSPVEWIQNAANEASRQSLEGHAVKDMAAKIIARATNIVSREFAENGEYADLVTIVNDIEALITLTETEI